jgi:hypothetical protein
MVKLARTTAATATLLVRHSLRNHSAMATMNELIIHGTPKLGGWRHQVDIP